jgi:hypothetical protein
MAEQHMFPPNASPHPEAKIARLEAHVFHLSQKQKEQEDEFRELKKDREALLRYILWRLVIFLGLLIGALASKGSSDGSMTKDFFGALTGSLGL